MSKFLWALFWESDKPALREYCSKWLDMLGMPGDIQTCKSQYDYLSLWLYIYTALIVVFTVLACKFYKENKK